jgi:hypothetical protein
MIAPSRGICAQWELYFTSNVDISQLQREESMRTILLGLLAVSTITIATPVVPASAQVVVDTPVGGVRGGPTTTTTVTDTATVIAVMLASAALSPSAATTDLSVGFGAATKYHRLHHGSSPSSPNRRRALAVC